MSANFTPSMGSIKDMKPFKFWCQKVLPTVYDDSLSYYELLTKVVNYLNDNVDNINLLNNNVTNLYNAYVSLQEYVNNYFDQNFPELVSNKLDEMARDGTLTALIKAYIDPYFEEKSDEIDEAISAQNAEISEAIENQNASIDLLDTQMTQFIADHAGLVTETVLWSGEGSGDGFIFNLSDSATNYNYIDVHVDFTSMVTGSRLTYKGGVLRFNSQDFADGKCLVTIPVVNPNTSDIGVLEMRFTPDANVANRYTLVGCNKVTADTNGFQLEVVSAGLPAGTSANDPSCGGITKIVGVKNTQNDQEVINARIGSDSTVYPTLGVAIRTQVGNLKSTLEGLLAPTELFDEATGIANYEFYLRSDGATVHSEPWNVTKFIPLTDSMTYVYSGLTDVGGDAPVSIFYDANRNIVSYFKQATGTNNLIVPNGATQVKFSVKSVDLATFSVRGTPNTSIDDIISDIAELKNVIDRHDLDSYISWQNVRENDINNSAWSWWTYPQIECDVSARNRAYFGEVNTIGVAGIGSASLENIENVAKTNLCMVGKDDHNGMAIYKNQTGSSGRTFMVFGFKHNEDNYIREYIGAVEHNGDLYGNPIMIEFPNKTTYAQVFNTKESTDYTQNRLLLITRLNLTEWWGVFSNTYYGDSWGTPQPIIKADRQYYVMFRETTTDGLLRMVMYSNPNLTRTDTRIRMGFLDMTNGDIYNADGVTKLGNMATGGVSYTAFTIIINIPNYDISADVDATNELRNRLLDVAITAPNEPYIAYARFTNATDAEYYVYRNGSTVDVTACGDVFYIPSVYVGGLIFTPRDVNTIYLSRKIDNISRIEKWVYSNGSYSLANEIDRGTNGLIWCIRPIIDKDGTILFYQKGTTSTGTFEQYNFDAKAYRITN